MWIIIVVTFIVVCGVYCLGHWQGRKRCMIENGILFGKDANEFLKVMKEKETGVLYSDNFIEKESDADKNYRIHHGVSYKKFL